MSGDETRKSAVARLHATGMFQTTAIRSSALTSGSCGCGSSGSQKKMSMSMLALGDEGADLQVAAERTALQLQDAQPELLFEQRAGRARGHEIVARPGRGG